MATQTTAGSATSWAFLSKAETALAEGDLLQASRSGWCAAAYMLRGVARDRGWPYTGFRRLYAVTDRLVSKYGAEEIDNLFDSAAALADNRPRHCDSRAGIEHDLSRVAELLRKLEALSV